MQVQLSMAIWYLMLYLKLRLSLHDILTTVTIPRAVLQKNVSLEANTS